MSTKAAESNSAYPLAIELGPQFAWTPGSPITEIPEPMGWEIDRCRRLVISLRGMLSELLRQPCDDVYARFGVLSSGDDNYRYCLFSSAALQADDADPQGKLAGQAVEAFLLGIEGAPTSDLFRCELKEDHRNLVESEVRKFLESDGGVTFCQGLRVWCGDRVLAVPLKTLPKPKRPVEVERLVIEAFVDKVGHSSREIQVRDVKRHAVRAKFDVEEFLSRLCDELKLQGLCRFTIDEMTDECGSVTSKLLNFERLQGDFFGADPRE